jgi:hypothetical protein
MADSLWLMAGVAISRQPSAMSGAQSSPIIVKIIEPKKDTLADVLIGSLGLTGVLVLCAVVAAVIFGAVLFWVRSRSG